MSNKRAYDMPAGRQSPPSPADSTFLELDDLPPPRRTREKGALRVKSGCLSCRRRRKKCDEGKPSCKNCRSHGYKCEWPQIILRKRPSVCPDAENNQLSQDSENKKSVDPPFSGPHEPSSTVDSQPMDICTDGTAEKPSKAPDSSLQRAVSPGICDINQTSDLCAPESMPGTQAQPAHGLPQKSQVPNPEKNRKIEYSGPVSEDNDIHEELTTQAQQQSFLQTQSRQLAAEQPPQVSQAVAHDKDQAKMQHEVYKDSPTRRKATQEHASSQTHPTAKHGASLRPLTQPLFPSQYNAFTRTQIQRIPYGPLAGPTAHTIPQQHSLEKVKMMKGQTYNQSDPELAYDRAKCRVLLTRFNAGGAISVENRKQLMKSLLGSIGTNVDIEAPFRCEYGYNIKIGDDTYIGPDCIIEDPSIVSIGARCSIGPRVTICCKKSSPNLNDHDGCRTLFYGPGIWIEDRVSIEAGVIIHAGVRIGRGSTIVAGSVVTKSVRERSLVGGNPATVFQYV